MQVDQQWWAMDYDIIIQFHLHWSPLEVWDDLKLPGDSEDVPISEWSGWQFDSRYEILSLLDGKN